MVRRGDGELVNPANMMPPANQDRAEDQHAALSTDRVASTIPRGGDCEEKWVYPSQQMFYNALQRKGKAEGVDESSMASVVAIHNNMNERAWKEVVEWEQRHGADGADPQLVRFQGRPDELTPKARLKMALGLAQRPFDRHDWVVDRRGKEVRYVIDYYDVASKRDQDRMPQLHDLNSVPSIEMDVRPALDSVGSIVDRLAAFGNSCADAVNAKINTERSPSLAVSDGAPHAASAAASMPQTQSSASSTSGGPSSGGSGADAGTGGDGGGTPASTPSIASRILNPDAVRDRCADRMAALAECDSETACAAAHIGLTMCIAQQVCQDEANAFAQLKGTTDGAAAAERYARVDECVLRWAQQGAASAVGEAFD